MSTLGLTPFGCAHTGPPAEPGLWVRVVDERTNGIENARVIVTSTGSRVSQEDLTNPDGALFFGKLSPGVYNVRVKVRGYEECFRNGVRVDEGRTAKVELALSETPERMLTFPTLDPREPPVLIRGSVRGRFVDQAGHGIDSAYVTVYNDLHRYAGRTGRGGYFLVSGVAIGTYAVHVRVGGYGDLRGGVSVSEGDTTTVDFKRHNEGYR